MVWHSSVWIDETVSHRCNLGTLEEKLKVKIIQGGMQRLSPLYILMGGYDFCAMAAHI